MENNIGTCVGGLQAVTFFESLSDRIKPGEQDLYVRSMNRIKYEAAKGIGKKIRTIKAVKAWHHDTYACGKCGFGAGEAGYSYCPNCGTAYLKNSYTEECVKEYEEAHQITLDEWMNLET